MPAKGELKAPPVRHPRQHGVKGVYYGGDWVDIEDCDGSTFLPDPSKCSGCPNNSPLNPCPRSKSRHDGSKDGKGKEYDIVVVGAGCIGGAIARELSKYKLSVLVLEAADDVSQGATKGNSGIVHSGYDDKPGSLHAKFCWPGNQMFPQLDKELRFGYQKNGSLVLAVNEDEIKILEDLKKRGETNGVEHLRILNQKELRELEPAVSPNAVAALHSPSAGNVIPYEFAIALCENAADNGVEFRTRRQVTDIKTSPNGDCETLFEIKARHWEPKSYIDSQKAKGGPLKPFAMACLLASSTVFSGMGVYMALDDNLNDGIRKQALVASLVLMGSAFVTFLQYLTSRPKVVTVNEPAEQVAKRSSPPVGSGGSKIEVEDMFYGGSGWENAVNGETFEVETVTARYIINAAGGASDKIARMVGDNSFTILPRLGDYLLLNRNQGHLTTHTLFPCPDPVLGKGVLGKSSAYSVVYACRISSKYMYVRANEKLLRFLFFLCDYPAISPNDSLGQSHSRAYRARHLQTRGSRHGQCECPRVHPL